MYRMRHFVAAAVIVSGTACSDSFSPSVSTVAAAYTATNLRTTPNAGASVDQLALGATLNMVLNANGTVTGLLNVPVSAQNPSAFSANLTGTWTLNGDSVTFASDVDTFIRDLTFTASRNQLTANQNVANTRYEVTLTRTGA
ncbi:MAG: hypothetical protein H0U85_02450 [Gemmatimonadales bacterium]|nr:hypothetical protein [Gemmatimonadales bacterium]